MGHKNQAVLDMIEQVRARLVDLEEDVLAFDGDLSELAEKIDRIDDRLYLLEVDIEKRAAAADGDADGDGADEAGKPDGAKDAAGNEGDDNGAGDAGDDNDGDTDSDSDNDNGMNILTPEAKEKIGETVGDMRVIGREAAETFAQLNEAFSDITGPFKTLSGKGRR